MSLKTFFTGRAVGFLVVILAVAGFFYLNESPTRQKSEKQEVAKGYKDISYTIDGYEVVLVNGIAEAEVAPGSSAKLVTEYFGNEVEGDINGDGVADVVFLLTQSAGGSGTFYYVVAALRTDKGYTGTNAILLGDRIAPQTTEIRNGEIIVNYADRKAGEPMTAQPSVGVSKYLGISGNMLREIKI